MRYAYGLTTALLLGGATLSLISGYPAGAQVAQNDEARIAQIVPRTSAPASFADLTAQLQPAVVNISTRQKVKITSENPFAGTPFEGLFGGDGGGDNGGSGGGGQETREAQALGSGFIISSDGYVVTNNHVIVAEGHGEVETISVTLPDGTELPAKLIGRDSASDLAVLKVNAGHPLPFVKFGDSAKTRVGDWVLAIGNPFGLGGTVTAGIVSAVYRNTGTGGAYDRYIQTDAAINRGNSGGPMFDMKGQVIGINNAIFSPNGGSIGIGFAIPSEIAAPIVERLMKGQAIERGYLGIRIQPMSDDLADSLGFAHNRGELVQSVEPNQPAAAAGIKAGDLVVRVNGQEVTREQTVSYLVAMTAPGTRIPVELIRDGQHITLQVTVAKRPSEEELAQESFDPRQKNQDNPLSRQGQTESTLANKTLGLRVMPLTAGIAHQLGVSDDTHGLVVASVDPSSDAGAKGIERGDIIVSAQYQPTNTIAALDSAIKGAQAANRNAMLLRVIHRGQPPVYLAVRLR